MATTEGAPIAIAVATTAPAGAPAAFFADHGPDRWRIDYAAVGGALTLGASSLAPAELWAWDLATGTWTQLEAAFQISGRAVVDGKAAADLVQRAVPGIGALALRYPGLVDAGTAVYHARTVRVIQ